MSKKPEKPTTIFAKTSEDKTTDDKSLSDQIKKTGIKAPAPRLGDCSCDNGCG